MSDIVEICFSIKKNDYPTQTLVSHAVSMRVDSIAAFNCDVTDRYGDRAIDICRQIVREMEKDKALHKNIEAQPCCERFEMNREKVSREAQFCPFCGEEITTARREQFLKANDMENF